MKANGSSKKKEKKEKKRKTKKKTKRKKKRKIATLALKPEHSLRGIWRKPLKPGALSQLVGSHRLSARYTGGWVEFSKL